MTNKNWTKDELENYNLLVQQTVRRCKKPDKVRESVEALAFIATEAKHKEAIAERRQDTAERRLTFLLADLTYAVQRYARENGTDIYRLLELGESRANRK